MITNKLEKQYMDFINTSDLPESKMYMVQYSYIKKIIEFATKENNIKKAEEYKQKRDIIKKNLLKYGIEVK